MANIADLFGRLLLDDSGFEGAVVKSAEKAGDKAGPALGARLGKGLAIALGTTLALATKGALDLDEASRPIAANLGLAADAQGRLKNQVNDLFKANPSKGYAEIAGTIGALRQEMQLGEEEAATYGQRILNWSKLTGQDGVTAVRSLDNVLDAYNLTAADGIRIQDALIGAQRAGAGPAAENLRILGELAPALTAANMGWEDGVGFLMATGKAGISAETGVNALRTALTKVKSPEELQRLIEQIRNTPDDFDRAALAGELFGTRAGVKMATLLRPGSDALKDVTLDMASFEGAVTKGADVIDDSFKNKIAGAIRAVTAPLAELGVEGPAILGAILGIQAISTAFNLMKIRAILAWAAAAGPGALAAAAALAAALIIIEQNLNNEGDAAASNAEVSNGWTEALKAAKPAVTETGVAAEGAVAPTNAWGVAIRDATDAAAAGVPTNEALAVSAKQAGDTLIRYGVQAETAGAGTGHLKAEADALNQSIPKTGSHFRDLGSDARDLTQDVLSTAEALARLDRASKGFGIGVGERIAAAGDDPNDTARAQTQIDAAEDLAADQAARREARERAAEKAAREREAAANKAAREREQALAKEQRRLEDVADTARNKVGTAFDALREIGVRALDRIHDRTLRAIEDQRTLAHVTNDARLDEAIAAQDTVELNRQRRDLLEELTEAQRDLAKATTPEDQASAARRVRSAAEAWQSFNARQNIAAITAEVNAANAAADKAAADATTAENTRATREKKLFEADLAALEKRIANGETIDVHAELMKLFGTYKLDYENAGANLGQSFADGLASKAAAVEVAAKALADAAAAYLKVKSPTEKGPLSEDQSKWGWRLGTNWLQGLMDSIAGFDLPGLKGIVDPLGGASAPYAGVSSAAGAAAGLSASMNVTVDLGTEFANRFGGDRFIRMIDRDLHRLGS